MPTKTEFLSSKLMIMAEMKNTYVCVFGVADGK